MLDREGRLGTKAWLGQELLVLGLWLQLAVHLLQERRILTRRQARLLIQQRQQTKLGLNHINTRLVVCKVDKLPWNLLSNVLLLLELEYMQVELVLETLIRIVDAKLLKRVHLEAFKAVNVQHTNHRHR